MRLALVYWRQVLLPHVPVLEIFTRGMLVYLGSSLMLCPAMGREFGAPGMPDVIVIGFIAGSMTITRWR